MSQVVGPITDRVLEQVRDKQGAIHSKTLVRLMLSHAQFAINVNRKSVMETTALATEKLRLFYPILGLLPNSLKVETVRDGNRDLDRITLKALTHSNLSWFREIGDRFEAFVIIGRDLLILYPALPFASSVNVVYSKKPAVLLNSASNIELSDEDILPLIDLTSIILLARARKFDTLEKKIQDLAERMRKPTV